MNILDSAGLGYFWGKIKSFFVTALGTNGNYLTWTKNGTTNNITVPFATTSSKVGSSTVGSSTKPVYINSGTPTAVSGVSELYISNGWPEGCAAGYVPPTILPLVLTTAGNKLALLPPSQVIIEKTTDGGTTWVSAGISDSIKQALFLGTDASGTITVPLLNGTKNKLCGIRITITGMKYDVPEGTAETDKYQYWNENYVKGTERYVTLGGMYFWVNTNSDKLRTRVKCATGKAPDTWIAADNGNNAFLSGWSGGNYIFLRDRYFGGGVNQTDRYWNYRIEFFTDGTNGGNLSTSYTATAQTIHRIYGYGRDAWIIPNRLVGINHLYTWDAEQTMITKGVRPDANNTHSLGNSSYKWANVYATTFHGSLDGNASTATKATQDASGNVITSTYATKTEVASLQDIVGGKVTKIVLGTVDYTPSSGVVTLPAYPTTLPASDVSDWAKAANKPSYSFSEITGTAAASQIPTLAISKISNLQSTLDAKVIKVKLGTTEYSPSSGVISLPAYPTTLPASDVSAWAKAATKPTYSFSEITGSISATQMHAGINNLTEGTSDPVDNDYYIAQYAGGGTTTKTYHRKKHSSLFNYIKGKLPSWSTASAKPTYSLDEVADGSTRKLANYLPLSGGTMSSTSVVTSLNADMLDGKHLSDLLYENTGGWCAGSGSYWGKILEGVMDVTGTVDTTITLLVSSYTTTSNGYFGLLVIDVRGDNKSKINNIKANWVLLTNSTMVSYTKVTHDYVDGKRYVRVYVYGSGWGHSINVKILNEHKWAGKSLFTWNTYKSIYNGNQVPTYASIPTTDTETEVTIAIKSILNNASSATQLANERTLTIGSTGKKFDGSANVSWSLAEIGAAAASHNHNIESLTNYSSIVTTNTDQTISGNKTFSSDLTIFSNAHRDTYYASNVCRLFYQTTYDEFVIYTKIKYNAVHMPVVRMYGYAYGLQSPIELKVGFYIYQKVIGYCGVISQGAWKPAVYLWKYTHTDNVEYIAIGLKGECYFCGFQVDVQIGASGSFNTIATSGWTVNGLKATADNFLIPQEATDDNRLVQVPYKTIKTDISGNITGNSGSATKLATARTLTIGSTGKGFDGSANVSWSLAEIGALPISGGTMTGVLKMQADQYADSYSGALNMSNSNIFGVNSIYTADASENSPEGIHFYRSATAVDTIYAKSGVFYFVPNRTLGTNGTSYKIWHEGNISELRTALSIPNGTITSVTYNGTTVNSGAVDLGDVLTSDDDVAYVDNVGEVVVPSTLIKLVTQAQYDAITNKDSETIYIVVDNESDAGADATISHFAIVSLTTAEYEALEEKDDQTLYLIS